MSTASPTLAIDQEVRRRIAAGERIVHLGFGEAGLPVPAEVLSVLAAAAPRNSYGPVVGSPGSRAAAAGWFTRRGTATDAEQIIFAPGSKPLLFALLAAIDGDVVLPRPSWVSYAAQAALVGREVIGVPIGERAGGVPDPVLLTRALSRARAAGRTPGCMVLTVPDNPTGTVADVETVRQVLAVAEEFGLVVVADEIYAELTYAGTAPQPERLLPERTVVTTGLSKSMSLGGWRIGLARVPATPWGAELMGRLVAIASEIWSALAAPMQAVAEYVLDDPPEMVEHIARARALHAALARAVHGELVGVGVRCRPPSAAFYLYPDFEPHREHLASLGVRTSADLAGTLLERHGIAVLPGQAFGDAPEALRVRVATSLLSGADDEQRWAALSSADPLGLPWVSAQVAVIGAGLCALLDAVPATGA